MACSIKWTKILKNFERKKNCWYFVKLLCTSYEWMKTKETEKVQITINSTAYYLWLLTIWIGSFMHGYLMPHACSKQFRCQRIKQEIPTKLAHIVGTTYACMINGDWKQVSAQVRKWFTNCRWNCIPFFSFFFQISSLFKQKKN